jgi:hypothetical protein
MHNKKIDEGWKAKVKKEKEDLTKEQNEAGPTLDSRAESQFLSLIQSLVLKTEMLLQAGRIPEAKQIVETIMVLDLKTEPTQTSREKTLLGQLKMHFRAAQLIDKTEEEQEVEEEPETD